MIGLTHLRKHKMTFLIWHILAICTVIAVSFTIGFSIGKTTNKERTRQWIKK